MWRSTEVGFTTLRTATNDWVNNSCDVRQGSPTWAASTRDERNSRDEARVNVIVGTGMLAHGDNPVNRF